MKREREMIKEGYLNIIKVKKDEGERERGSRERKRRERKERERVMYFGYCSARCFNT